MAAVADVERSEQAKDEDPLTCHRASNYVELGFDIENAFGLAKARVSKGFFVYWGHI
jgi:hypothetical protein